MKRSVAVFIVCFVLFDLYYISNNWPGSNNNITSVEVVGDSLVFGSTDELNAQISSRGWSGSAHGYIGATTEIAKVATEISNPSTGGAYVIALGSNDARFVQESPNPQLALQMIFDNQRFVINQLSTAGANCIVWVGVQDDTPMAFLDVWGAQINTGLQATTKEFNNTHFLDWASIQRDHPEYRHADGLHFSPSGELGYATAITDFVSQEC